MTQTLEEKRRFNRIPFSYQDNIVGVFTHPGQADKITSHILNFSMQGLYFTMRKEDGSKLSEGDQLALLDLLGPKQTSYIVNIEMVVMRILDHSDLEYIGYGCKFTSFPESSIDQIKRFLEEWFIESREA